MRLISNTFLGEQATALKNGRAINSIKKSAFGPIDLSQIVATILRKIAFPLWFSEMIYAQSKRNIATASWLGLHNAKINGGASGIQLEPSVEAKK